MKKTIKYLICLAALFGTLFVAATSSYGCWIFIVHQRECPKSLIKVD
jgi:cyclic lactone autoinducer peptide